MCPAGMQMVYDLSRNRKLIWQKSTPFPACVWSAQGLIASLYIANTASSSAISFISRLRSYTIRNAFVSYPRPLASARVSFC